MGEESFRRFNTIIITQHYCFFNDLYFVLQSVKEYSQLSHHPAPVVENPGERPHLIYTEDQSKNRPGGIRGRNQKPKIVVHHANLEQPKHCFVRLFKLYNSLCPKNHAPDSLYLQPLLTLRIVCSKFYQSFLPALPKSVPIILILFSYHYLLFPYYSFALMLQVHIDIQRNKNLLLYLFTSFPFTITSLTRWCLYLISFIPSLMVVNDWDTQISLPHDIPCKHFYKWLGCTAILAA